MSATTQPTTFLDLYTDLQNRVRSDTTVTATSNIAKRYINTALQDMHIGYWEGMSWCERKAVLRTQADYVTGTVTITRGSTTLTGTGTAWNTNNDFSVANARTTGKIAIGNNVYRISSVGSDTSITLTDPFVDSDLTAGAYTYFEDDYALATDFLRPIDWRSFDDAGEIELISRGEFRRRYPRNSVPGKPRVATIEEFPPSGNTTPIRRVRFWRPPDDFYLVPYTYVTANLVVSSTGTAQRNFSADTDEPIVPLQYRHVIVLHALRQWYRDRRDDNRAADVDTEYNRLLGRIVGDTEPGAQRPQIRPRVSPYRWAAKRPWRGGSRRHVTGSRFDELR